MPGHYSKSGASKGAKTIDPFNSKSTESGKVNDDEKKVRHNPWEGKNWDPTRASETSH